MVEDEVRVASSASAIHTIAVQQIQSILELQGKMVWKNDQDEENKGHAKKIPRRYPQWSETSFIPS